jgi:hypothetical protein
MMMHGFRTACAMFRSLLGAAVFARMVQAALLPLLKILRLSRP